jgi:AAA family ATPase
MSESLGLRAVEVKIRSLPNAERTDRKDVSRVFLSIDTMLDLRLEAGQPCYLWKIDDVDTRKREAIAWLSAQKINRNVMQMFKPFQDHCGFRLEDRIAVAAAGNLCLADTVILRDVSESAGPLEENDRPHWEWYLEDKLGMLYSYVQNYYLYIISLHSLSVLLEIFARIYKTF